MAKASRARKRASTVRYQISERVTRQASTRAYRWRREQRKPVTRQLWIYTLDPSVSDREGGVTKVEVPWEELDPGPKGQLFEVVAGQPPEPLAAVTEPLDLDDPELLVTDGVPPSPSDPRFHLQMAYAVCSLTYAAFRRALGRDIAWAIPPGTPTATDRHRTVRLQIRPFAFEERNAHYRRDSGDLAFGWFRAGARPAGFTIPGGLVFTVLSHDIIAHETTHALLDGLRANFQEPTNPDVLAFHEGFADLVALFLHFTYPGVVEQSLRRSRGVVGHGSLLTDIAREFGYARTGDDGAVPVRRALRSGIDVEGIHAFDSDEPPDGRGAPVCYDPTAEPHALGTVLVSAVFEAFVTIARRKTARLTAIAGVDPQDLGTKPLSDALLAAIGRETCAVAGQFLTMCIRAIDYCPPVDMLLGEYLRALVTADLEVEPVDTWGYREALMRSFRRRRIFPAGVPFMTEDALRWQPPDTPPETRLKVPGLAFGDLRFDGDPGRPADEIELTRQADALGRFVTAPERAHLFMLLPVDDKPPTGFTQVAPAIIDSIRIARRVAPDGRILFDTIAEVTQSCTATTADGLVDLIGGCTIVINQDGVVRYTIGKRVTSHDRLARQMKAIRGPLKGFWTSRSSRGKRHLCKRAGMLARLHGQARS